MLVPLILVEVYLLFTVYLAIYGPIDFNIDNKREFLFYILAYHLAFVFGYLVNCIWTKHSKKNKVSKFDFSTLVVRYYWLILFLAFLGGVIFLKNITMSDTIIPYGIVDAITQGILNPAQARNVYAEKLFSSKYTGDKYLSALMLFLGVFKYSLLPIMIFKWTSLSLIKKVFGIFVVMIPLFGGIAMSLSSINFSYLFTISVCLLVVYMSADLCDGGVAGIKRRKAVLLSFIVMIFFSFWQFYAVKSGVTIYGVVVRGEKPATFDYLEKNHVTINKLPDNNDITSAFLMDFYQKLTVYLAQGYKGMSISLSEPFDSTYGVGHSVFLQHVFEDYLGFNIREKTFQRKITDRWDENIYWHSAYSYFANDVSFFGVTFIMFAIGLLFSKVVNAALAKRDFIAKLLIPLFALMFLYFPANNQVFSFLESMISFWVLTLTLFVSNIDRVWCRYKNITHVA